MSLRTKIYLEAANLWRGKCLVDRFPQLKTLASMLGALYNHRSQFIAHHVVLTSDSLPRDEKQVILSQEEEKEILSIMTFDLCRSAECGIVVDAQIGSVTIIPVFVCKRRVFIN